MPYDPERHGPERIVGPGFFEKVYAVVQEVPAGRVTTYGDIAEALGMRSIARKVGHALAGLSHDRDVPWFRVVNAQGAISRPLDSGHGREQAERLRAEGIEVSSNGKIQDFTRVRFVPQH